MKSETYRGFSTTATGAGGYLAGVQRELVVLSDEVWQRIRARLEGLSDDEYFWEPAEGCWTVRPRADGTWTADWPLPRPEPEPFTTIAWRLWHLLDMYGENRAPEWLGVPPQGDPIGMDDPGGEPPSTATAAVALLERAHDRWDAHLALATDAVLAEPIGPVAGPLYAERTRTAYVLHMLDEFIHHGAEIALLRDLWRWQHAVSDDPRVERVIRGDASVLDDLGDTPPGADLVDHAASYGRWDLVLALVRRGAPVSTSGRTPLHLAAGAGELAVVQELLEAGADPAGKDPEYRATPLQWAQFLKQARVAEFLTRLREQAGDAP